MTSFIHKITKSIEKSISEIHEKFLGNVRISLALSFMASSFAFFYCGRGSNWQNCDTKEKTERMGKWSDHWWRSFLTLHDSREFFKSGDVKTKSIVVSRPLSEHVIDPWGSRRCKK
jgi:hypothetical protein